MPRREVVCVKVREQNGRKDKIFACKLNSCM